MNKLYQNDNYFQCNESCIPMFDALNMELQDAIQLAAWLAYDEDADQYVIRGDHRQWKIVHNEDPEAFGPGVTARFLVHSDGVDEGHIQRGEITEDLELTK